MSVTDSRILKEARDLHPFLFMGCWNRKGSGRDAVLTAIKKDSVPLLVLGGDNAYPDKTKSGDKRYILADVMSGLDGLPKDREVYVGIGNHNIDKWAVTNSTHSIYEIEQEYPDWNLPYNYYCVLFEDKRALIFLDTNLFKRGGDINGMLRWFKATLQHTIKRHGYKYYIIQHDPFFSIKSPKPGRTVPRKTHLSDSHRILDTILEVNCLPIAILCADTHNYQEWDLDYKGHTFHQAVVGTGGAKPDPVPGLQHLPYTTTFVPGDDLFETIHLIEGTPFSSLTFTTPSSTRERVPGYGYYRLFDDKSHLFRLVQRWPGGLNMSRSKSRSHRSKTRRPSRSGSA
jgi:hypothetical protein